MSQNITVLYDGWALAYQPASWEAIHLRSLLAELPAGIRARVALPAPAFEPLPAHVEALLQPEENSPWRKLRWEQKTLPGLARSSRPNLLHLMGIQAALFGALPQVISPAGYASHAARELSGYPGGLQEAARPTGMADRLRVALGQGGFSRAAGVFWPSDLPLPDTNIRIIQLPPLIHPLFSMPTRENVLPDLPETYILYHGPQTEAAIQRLVDAWSWATGSIGEYYPLLVLGFDQVGVSRLNNLLEKTSLAKSVSLLPPLSMKTMACLYQNCTAVFHPVDISPWGGPLRLALLCARPLVALETPFSDALVGPAGYLVNPQKPELGRALGAALITVIVEESVAASLAQAARERMAGRESVNIPSALEKAYRDLLEEY